MSLNTKNVDAAKVVAQIRSRGWQIKSRKEILLDKNEPISDVENLEDILFLSLSHRTEIDDNWAEKIGAIQTLRSLHIDCTKVTNKGIEYLTALNDLIYLNLRGCPITYGAIPAISEIESLNYLWLNDTGLGQESLEPLINLNNLTNLFLCSTGVKDHSIKCLAEIKSIEYLNLYGTDITKSSFDVFKKLPNLKSLTLTRTRINESDAAELQKDMPQVMIDTYDW